MKDPRALNYYECLGVSEDAEQEEIRAAHKRLVKELHPDQHSGPYRTYFDDLIKGVNEAYDTLKDPEKRAGYDLKLRDAERRRNEETARESADREARRRAEEARRKREAEARAAEERRGREEESRRRENQQQSEERRRLEEERRRRENQQRAEEARRRRGGGDAAYVPPEVQGWNWGAFLLNWIWSLFNLSGGKAALSFLLGLIPLLNIGWAIVLGVKGNEWAWREKRWHSLEHFRSVQRKWTLAGAIVFVGSILLSVVLASWS